jgi:hypothetical protein
VFVFRRGQAFGQITTSDIVGTVSDATGALVMNAKVAVTITATADTRKQLSGWDGGFVFNPLLPGLYTVTVEAPRFSRMLSNVTVVAGDRARVDAQLLSRKLIPRRGKRCLISTNRTCWNKA